MALTGQELASEGAWDFGPSFGPPMSSRASCFPLAGIRPFLIYVINTLQGGCGIHGRKVPVHLTAGQAWTAAPVFLILLPEPGL